MKENLVTVVTWPVENGMYAGRMQSGQFHALRVGENRTVCGRPIGWPFFLRDVTKLVWREVHWRLTYVDFPGVMGLHVFQDPKSWEPKWREKCCQQCAKGRTK